MKCLSVLSHKLFYVIFILLLTAQANAGINDIEIRVLPESIVYKTRYSLGDIAELDGFDLTVIKKLATLEIGKSPLPGRSLKVSARYLESKLRRTFKGVSFNLKVPSTAIISRAAIKVTKDQLKEIVLAEVQKQYTDYEDVDISIKTRLKDIFIPKGKSSYRMKRLGKKDRIGGYNSWTLSFLQNQKEVKKIIVRVKVNVFDEVYVAKSRIIKGRLIQKSDLKKVKKDISRERKSYQSSPDLIVGQQARRDIFTNESIDNHLIDKPVILDKGSPVRVVYKTKNLYLTNLAKTMKSGRKGDIIPVRTMKSKTTIYAMVIDSKHVEVIL